MKTIDINWNDQVYTVKVDDGAHEILSRHTWYMMFSGEHKKPYAFAELYSKKKGQERVKRMFYMHQMVTGSFTQIDHKNGDTLDNQFDNLRIATYQENGWNSIKRQVTCSGKPPSSQYKGVTRCKRANGEFYWRVLIKLSAKHEKPSRFVRLGPFDSEIAAARAYNEEVVKHRGEWALLNIINHGF